MKMIERDRMPIEVATEMACAPWSRKTNRERKMLRDARQVEWASEAERKPVAGKLARKLQDKPIAWLFRQARRTARKRGEVQRVYESRMRLTSSPLVDRMIAALNLRAAQLDLLADAIDDTIKYRMDLTKGITTPENGALMWPGFGYTRTWVSGLDWVFRQTDFPRWVSSRMVVMST